WQVSGLFTHQSGIPFSIYSGASSTTTYGTFVRGGQSGNNTVNTNLTKDQLDALMGLRFAGNGPFFLNTSAIGSDNRANTQTFVSPSAGTLGALQRRLFSGPWDTSIDFGAMKITKITERQSLVLRMDSTNILNHPAFSVGDQYVTS